MLCKQTKILAWLADTASCPNPGTSSQNLAYELLPTIGEKVEVRVTGVTEFFSLP